LYRDDSDQEADDDDDDWGSTTTASSILCPSDLLYDAFESLGEVFPTFKSIDIETNVARAGFALRLHSYVPASFTEPVLELTTKLTKATGNIDVSAKEINMSVVVDGLTARYDLGPDECSTVNRKNSTESSHVLLHPTQLSMKVIWEPSMPKPVASTRIEAVVSDVCRKHLGTLWPFMETVQSTLKFESTLPIESKLDDPVIVLPVLVQSVIGVCEVRIFETSCWDRMPLGTLISRDMAVTLGGDDAEPVQVTIRESKIVNGAALNPSPPLIHLPHGLAFTYNPRICGVHAFRFANAERVTCSIPTLFITLVPELQKILECLETPTRGMTCATQRELKSLDRAEMRWRYFALRLAKRHYHKSRHLLLRKSIPDVATILLPEVSATNGPAETSIQQPSETASANEHENTHSSQARNNLNLNGAHDHHGGRRQNHVHGLRHRDHGLNAHPINRPSMVFGDVNTNIAGSVTAGTAPKPSIKPAGGSFGDLLPLDDPSPPTLVPRDKQVHRTITTSSSASSSTAGNLQSIPVIPSAPNRRVLKPLPSLPSFDFDGDGAASLNGIDGSDLRGRQNNRPTAQTQSAFLSVSGLRQRHSQPPSSLSSSMPSPITPGTSQRTVRSSIQVPRSTGESAVDPILLFDLNGVTSASLGSASVSASVEQTQDSLIPEVTIDAGDEHSISQTVWRRNRSTLPYAEGLKAWLQLRQLALHLSVPAITVETCVSSMNLTLPFGPDAQSPYIPCQPWLWTRANGAGYFRTSVRNTITMIAPLTRDFMTRTVHSRSESVRFQCGDSNRTFCLGEVHPGLDTYFTEFTQTELPILVHTRIGHVRFGERLSTLKWLVDLASKYPPQMPQPPPQSSNPKVPSVRADVSMESLSLILRSERSKSLVSTRINHIRTSVATGKQAGELRMSVTSISSKHEDELLLRTHHDLPVLTMETSASKDPTSGRISVTSKVSLRNLELLAHNFNRPGLMQFAKCAIRVFGQPSSIDSPRLPIPNVTPTVPNFSGQTLLAQIPDIKASLLVDLSSLSISLSEGFDACRIFANCRSSLLGATSDRSMESSILAQVRSVSSQSGQRDDTILSMQSSSSLNSGCLSIRVEECSMCVGEWFHMLVALTHPWKALFPPKKVDDEIERPDTPLSSSFIPPSPSTPALVAPNIRSPMETVIQKLPEYISSVRLLFDNTRLVCLLDIRRLNHKASRMILELQSTVCELSLSTVRQGDPITDAFQEYFTYDQHYRLSSSSTSLLHPGDLPWNDEANDNFAIHLVPSSPTLSRPSAAKWRASVEVSKIIGELIHVSSEGHSNLRWEADQVHHVTTISDPLQILQVRFFCAQLLDNA
jgi:hypothetical protein